jgi:hypothetical protein
MTPETTDAINWSAEKTGMTWYDTARVALVNAAKVDEVIKFRNQAERAQLYARQAKDTGLQFHAAEIKLRAERRVGEILIADAKSGARLTQATMPGAGKDAEKRVLKDYGVTSDQSTDWQRNASVPEKYFEAALKAAKEMNEVPTTTQIARMAADLVTAPEREAREKKRLLSVEKNHAKRRAEMAEHEREFRARAQVEIARRKSLGAAGRQEEDEFTERAQQAEEYAERQRSNLTLNAFLDGDEESPRSRAYQAYCTGIAFESLTKSFTIEAKRLHPDTPGGSAAAMANLNALWQNLKFVMGKK